jgi:hypothetical protein
MARTTNKPDAAEKKTEAVTKEARPASREIRETVVYMGPNHPAGFLSHGQVFKPPLAGPAAKVLDDAPEIMGPLFIPLAKIVKAKQAQAEPGSDLNRAYAKAAQHLAGGK